MNWIIFSIENNLFLIISHKNLQFIIYPLGALDGLNRNNVHVPSQRITSLSRNESTHRRYISGQSFNLRHFHGWTGSGEIIKWDLQI